MTNDSKQIDIHPFWKAAKAHATENGGWATIRRKSREHLAWARYFRAWRLWTPWCINKMNDGQMEVVLMPAQWPEWFDDQFAAADAKEVDRSDEIIQRPKPRLRQDHPRRLANVFISADRPQYANAVEWTADADPTDWKHDPAGRPGIWVSLSYFDGQKIGKGGPKRLTGPTDAQLRARYSRQESQEAAE